MGDWGEIISFPFLGVKVLKWPYLWLECYQRTKKMSVTKDNFSCFCHFLEKKGANKMPFPMLEILKNAKLLLAFYIIYDKKDLDLLYILVIYPFLLTVLRRRK